MSAPDSGHREAIAVQILGPDDRDRLDDVAPGVFDGTVDRHLSMEFLADRRHHLAVALSKGQVVGMASAVHYVHPDRQPELWINEVGVAPEFRRRGLAARMIRALLERGRDLGCREAWVLTEEANEAARGLYERLGGVEDRTPIAYAFRLS